MSLLWHIPDYVPNAYQEVELATAIDPMYLKMENMLSTEDNCKFPLKNNLSRTWVAEWSR